MSPYYKKSFQRSFGTFPLKGDNLLQAMQSALDVGFRAFDTAQMYGNEADVGEALSVSPLAREEICVTTKVHPDNYSEKLFMNSVEQSLTNLRLDHVDVLLLHWPPKGGNVKRSLELLEQVYERGLAKNIGVSNYNVAMLRDAVKIISAPIATNQVEFHPLLDQSKLMAGANELGIPLSAYCPVARGAIFKEPLLAEIGENYSKSTAQIALRWILQKGVSLNVMSTKRENLSANFDIMDFTLSNADMARIDALSKRNYRIVTREVMPIAPDFD